MVVLYYLQLFSFIVMPGFNTQCIHMWEYYVKSCLQLQLNFDGAYFQVGFLVWMHLFLQFANQALSFNLLVHRALQPSLDSWYQGMKPELQMNLISSKYLFTTLQVSKIWINTGDLSWTFLCFLKPEDFDGTHRSHFYDKLLLYCAALPLVSLVLSQTTQYW